MWGHSVSDSVWKAFERATIWNDLQDMVSDLPWFFGLFFWWAPVVFFAVMGFMGFYAMFFAGFWVAGAMALIVGKFMGAAWIRYAHRVVHPVLSGMSWYDPLFTKVSASKKNGLQAFYATGLSTAVSGVYNKAMDAVDRKVAIVRARIHEIQENRK